MERIEIEYGGPVRECMLGGRIQRIEFRGPYLSVMSKKGKCKNSIGFQSSNLSCIF